MGTDYRRFETLDALVEHEMERLKIPGATVAVLRDGEVDARGYGVISLATGYPTRPDTLFQIGSNTKVFTATLAMNMREQGLISLDTPIREYLPDLKLADERALATLTLRHMFTHTSGLEGDIFADFGVGDDALAKGVEQAFAWGQETDPDEVWSYCNSGYYLAGRVLEVVLNQVYETAMSERLFKPLGLERTFWFAHEAIVYSAAAGHVVDPGQEEPHLAFPYAIPRACNPAGAIISNGQDLCTFLAFHMGDGAVNGERILSQGSLRAMRDVRVSVSELMDWGIGWGLRRMAGTHLVEHGGGTNGHITQMLCVPEKNFGLVVLTNSSKGGGLIEQIEKWTLDRYCGLVEEEASPYKQTDAELARFTGRYSRPIANLEISAVDGGLTLVAAYENPFSHEWSTLPAVHAERVSEWEFVATDGDFAGSRVQFIPGEAGKIRFIRFGGRLLSKQA